MAFGDDLFNDGRIDVVVNNLDGTPSFLKNVTQTGNHWVELRLLGRSKSPRDAIGATVYVQANGFRQRRDVVSGGSYASSSDQRLHFGLGAATKFDAVEIRWPSGAVEHILLPGVDAIYSVSEGSGTAVLAGPL